LWLKEISEVVRRKSDISEENIASILKFEEKAKQETSRSRRQAEIHLHVLVS
jgi:hypothetical protein